MTSLAVLGIEDRPEGDQNTVYGELREQLLQRGDGKYETSLPWKAEHPTLPTDYNLMQGRFHSLLRKIEQTPAMLAEYHSIIKGQLDERIMEKATEKAVGKEHCVLREAAETTKLRIVYDASTKENSTSPSLNECLDIGPTLQRKSLMFF